MAESYKIFTIEDSARVKGMWAGALERTVIPKLSGVYAADTPMKYEIREIKRDHTPAILKIVDEGLVNASDHKKEHENAPKACDRVSRISLKFDASTGIFVIENDGPGIPITVHAEASAVAGREIFVPEVAFAIFLAGRNMEKPPDSVKGGINGIGAKLINVHSTVFTVETVSNGRMYTQTFRDRMRVRGAPQITTVGKLRSFTRISFCPAYAELGYDGGLTEADAADLEAYTRLRMFLLAAYVGSSTVVTFNDECCSTTSAHSLLSLAVAHDPGAVIMKCAAKATEAPYSAHPWDIGVAVLPNAKQFGHISVINGVHCTKGSHLPYLKKYLSETVGAKLARFTKAKTQKISTVDACKQVFLVVIGALPGADWGGQRKDELQVAESKLRPYTIAPAALGKIAGAIVDSLLQVAPPRRKKNIDVEKYIRARRAGGPDSAACTLLAAEGDSAITLLRAGLSLGSKANPNGPTSETYGIMSLGGVLMNAQKKVTEVETAGGGTLLIRAETLRNNKVLTALVDILGLDYSCQYETPAERARLRYGAMVICTDQDLDGVGKIAALVLVFIYTFWPNLIKEGFLKRLSTALIRAYPNNRVGPVKEFFCENEFHHWVRSSGGEAGEVCKYNVKYYKGLATHDSNEVLLIFRQFNATVYTYTITDASEAYLFKVYFGDQPALRRKALSTPVQHLSLEETKEIHRTRLISCRNQLEVDTKAYKLDDIQRKIPRTIDGIPVARRKILAGAIKRFSDSGREIKVFQLGGYVADHMFYHHGDASLNGTIIGMAQRFSGANNYPYLIGIGQFGSRHGGAKGAPGSPRYLNVKLAAPYVKAMFPSEDTWLLPYVFEDGERAQPDYFVPVLPAALLESFEIPSEGWRHKSFARAFGDVVALTRAYIGQGPPEGVALAARVAAAAEAARPGTNIKDLPLPADDTAAFLEQFPLGVSLLGYGDHLNAAEQKELIRPYNGYLHSFGWYVREKGPAGSSIIRVIELPLGKTTHRFLKELEKPARKTYIIGEPDDDSSGLKVNISIRLRPNAWEEITEKFGSPEIDPIEDFLLLRASLKPSLNYFGRDGGVVEFGDDYHALFFQWAPTRRDLYRRRLEREMVVLSLRIRLERAIIRFIEAGIDLTKILDENAASEFLAQHGFPQFDAALIHAPHYTPTVDIERLSTSGPRVSHNYILTLYERDLVTSAKIKREKKINKMEQRAAEVNDLLAEQPFAGASVWAAEINAVAAAVARGEKSGWRFEQQVGQE